jgi:hypothetical protein
MSLNFNLNGIPDKDIVCFRTLPDGSKELKGITECIIWSTMIVGIPIITEKNHKEFHTRCLMADSVHGKMVREMSDDGTIKTRSLTLEEVKAHIRLETNASTMSVSEFDKNMIKALRRKSESR